MAIGCVIFTTVAVAAVLYRSLGFTEIAPYCQNPLPGPLFMELTLG